MLSVYQGKKLSIDQIRIGLGLTKDVVSGGIGYLKQIGYATKEENDKRWQINQSKVLDDNGNYCYQPDKKYPPHIITRSQIKAILDRAYDPEYQKMFNT